MPQDEVTEIGLFLARVTPSAAQLAAAGWHTTIASDQLPDTRQLWVVAGSGKLDMLKSAAVESGKRTGRQFIPNTPGNYRLVLFAGEGHDPRVFTEVAA
jgi:hypothetical protein